MKKYIFVILLVSFPSFSEEGVDCDKAYTTIEINICVQKKADEAYQALEVYLAKIREIYASEKTTIKALDKSQAAWLVYRNSYCDAVYEKWSDGTIRGSMFGGCMLKLTKLRTYTIWEDYLTYMDSTPPMLPEPKLWFTQQPAQK